jgi:hypothetical protein
MSPPQLPPLLIPPIAIHQSRLLWRPARSPGQQLLQQILQPARARSGAKPSLRRHGEQIIVEAVAPDPSGTARMACAAATACGCKEANPAAQRWASRNAGRFVTEISDETRAGIQELVTRRALDDGLGASRSGAADPRAGHRAHAAAGAGAAELPTALVADGAKPERIAQLTDRKSKQQIKYRSEVIASHELLSASNSGQSLLWREAVRTDLLGAATKRKWIITPDDRLCPLCAQMRGERAITGMDEPWSTPRGDVMIPQGIHVRCRCAQGLVIDEPGGGRARFRAALADPSSELLEILEVEAE